MQSVLLVAEKIDPNGVTPGVVGFIITAGIAVVAILLIMDMVRRMRRLRYREEAKLNIDAEEAVNELIESIDKDSTN